jgi:prepilin-type processing-associated H-X9-DG protein
LTSPTQTVKLFEITGNIYRGNDPQLAGNPLIYYTPSTEYYGKQASAGGDGYSTSSQLNGGGTATTLKYSTGYMYNMPPASQSGSYDSPDGRHNGGANYLMCDGHAKFLLASKVGAGTDAAPNYFNYAGRVTKIGQGYCGNQALAPAVDCAQITATFAIH